MKNIKTLGLIAIVAITALAFSTCDNNGGTLPPIWGNWTAFTSLTEEQEITRTNNRSGATEKFTGTVSEFLESRTENTADNPVSLTMQIDLGTMTSADSNWQKLLGILGTAGRFVDLYLSDCTIANGAGTEFNPVSTVSTGKDKIVSIALPDTAVSIGPNGNTYNNGAFYNFTVLKSFSGTALVTIGNYAFYNRENLTMTKLPSGITSIGNYAFLNCKNLALTELPAGIEIINESTFSGCEKLALKDLSGITSIGNSAFYRCNNLALTKLPPEITSIGNGAFQSCTKLALTELPAGITSINDSTFGGCVNLAMTKLPAGIISIGKSAFSGCDNLALTELPSGIDSISEASFFHCRNLALTELPSGVISIGKNAFNTCSKLTLTELPSGVTSIGESAFYSTNITLTRLPSGVTIIRDQTFEMCRELTQFTLHSGITSIGHYAFSSCRKLLKVTFEGTITTFAISTPFIGDLREKYLSENGGPGTYTIPDGNVTSPKWTKQQ
ncbi:MAG: leucine-rich repeat domain-containing protein [Treponema sp.]|jgi:hypothetical protein|nr:leucine-rich repeat domain-containing protein [Treponema sp.]